MAAALTGVVQVGTDADGRAQEQVVVGASLLKVRDQLLHRGDPRAVEPPAALRATLRDYQRHGLTWLAELTSLGLGACLADDMGLGKTITLIALHLHRHERGATGPTLVVCPASLLGNWEDEIHRFAPGRRRCAASTAARAIAGRRRATGSCSRRTARCGATPSGSPAWRWDLVVADEAQHVKNPRSSTARALRTIPSAARVALTGTPVENNLTELLGDPRLGDPRAARQPQRLPQGLGRRRSSRARSRRKAAQFAELIGPFLLRRRKSDPGIAPELPAKTETDHRLGLTREQVVLYEAFVRDTMDADRARRRGHPARAGARAAHRAQADLQPPGAVPQAVRRSGCPGARRSSTCSTSCSARSSPRTARCWSSPSTSRWRRLLEAHLARAGVPHQFLHGGTPVREREAMVRRFQAGEVAGLPAVAQGRRHRAQPDPRRPRRPLRPLVEPRRRGAGDRPRLPDRADPAGAGAPDDHPRHHRGADRRDARPQARAGRRGARPRRDRR